MSLVLLAGVTPGVQATSAVIGITVQLEKASKEIVTLQVESVHGGESFAVGHFTQFDAFQVKMVQDENAPFLELAAAEGTLFPNVRIAVFTSKPHPLLIYDLTNAFISSFQVGGSHGGDRSELVFTLAFENLDRGGPGAANGLLVRAPAHTLEAITLHIRELQAGPIDLNSLHVGQTFAVGHLLSDDPFQATMTLDKTSLLLEKAAILGTSFKTAQVTISTTSHKPYLVYHLVDVLVSSYVVAGGVASAPIVDFSLSPITATAHRP